MSNNFLIGDFTNVYEKVQENIVSNYRAGRTSLCAEDFEAIRDWVRDEDFVIENASRATFSGIGSK